MWQYPTGDDLLLEELLRCSEPAPIYHIHLRRGVAAHQVLMEYLHVAPSAVVRLVLHRVKLDSRSKGSKDFVGYRVVDGAGNTMDDLHFKSEDVRPLMQDPVPTLPTVCIKYHTLRTTYEQRVCSVAEALQYCLEER